MNREKESTSPQITVPKLVVSEISGHLVFDTDWDQTIGIDLGQGFEELESVEFRYESPLCFTLQPPEDLSKLIEDKEDEAVEILVYDGLTKSPITDKTKQELHDKQRKQLPM